MTVPERRLLDRFVEFFEHGAVIGQPGQQDLGCAAFAPLRSFDRARRASRCDARNANKPHSASSSASAANPPHSLSIALVSAPAASQLNQPTIRPRGSCSDWIWRPPCTAGSASNLKIAQAGAARDAPQLDVVGRVDIAEFGMKFVERALQRRMLRGFEPRFADLGNGKANGGAEQYRAGQQQRRKQRKTSSRANVVVVIVGRSMRTPQCRPPFPGRRSGHHTHAPQELPTEVLSGAD